MIFASAVQGCTETNIMLLVRVWGSGSFSYFHKGSNLINANAQNEGASAYWEFSCVFTRMQLTLRSHMVSKDLLAILQSFHLCLYLPLNVCFSFSNTSWNILMFFYSSLPLYLFDNWNHFIFVLWYFIEAIIILLSFFNQNWLLCSQNF